MTTLVTTPRVAGAGDAGGARLQVPWTTVLPLAALAALGSTFWIVAIRGAVGAVERTAPDAFPTWLRESTLMLPLYVFAVLGALTLALRWYGHHHRTRTTIATLLLIVAAVSLLATLVLIANAIYDYQLQATHLAAMNATHEPCNQTCVASQKHDALILQLRAIGFGTALITLSNLILLGLLTALRGGRLDLTTTRTTPQTTTPQTTQQTTPQTTPQTTTQQAATQQAATQQAGRFTNVEKFLLAALLGAALVHATTVPAQLTAWPAAGIAVLLLVIAQLDTALLYLLRLRTTHYAVTALVSAVPLLIWLYTHTAGLPLGPQTGTRPPLGLADTTLALLEAATLTVALTALHAHRTTNTTASGRNTSSRNTSSRNTSSRNTGSPQHPARLALAGVIAITTLGLAGGLGLLAVTTPTSHTNHTNHTTHSGPPTIVFGSTLKSANPDGR